MSPRSFVLPLLILSLSSCREAAVERAFRGGEIEYRFAGKECTVVSTHRVPAKGERADLRLRFTCAGEAAFLEGLRELARAWHEDRVAIRTIFVGRVDEQVVRGGPLGLSREVARLSTRSAEWDPRGGRARSGNSNAWMNEALGQPGLLAPYADALRNSGYEVSGVSVEKVRWQDAKDDPVLSREGLTGRLAWDALVHLRISI